MNRDGGRREQKRRKGKGEVGRERREGGREGGREGEREWGEEKGEGRGREKERGEGRKESGEMEKGK